MSGARRAVVSAGLAAVLTGALAWGVWSWAPWLWPRLFPTPAADADAIRAPLSDDVAERAFDQALVAAGGALPDRPPGERPPAALPRGLTPRALQTALREDPRLADAAVYITRADDLLWRLRVFDGERLVLQQDVRPWMSAAPPHPPTNPPELVVLLDTRDGDEDWVRRVLRWRSPVGLVLPPFAPTTLRRADEAARASREVVAVLAPGEPLADQLQAVPHAAAVLVEAPFPDPGPLLELLASQDLVLVDACPEGCVDPVVARDAGVPRLRIAGRVDGEEPDVALVRNLAVQRGYGLVLAPATKSGAAGVEALIDAATADGLGVVFAAEAARQHALQR